LIGGEGTREIKLAKPACERDHWRTGGDATSALGENEIIINVEILTVMDNGAAISAAPKITVQEAGIGCRLPS